MWFWFLVILVIKKIFCKNAPKPIIVKIYVRGISANRGGKKNCKRGVQTTWDVFWERVFVKVFARPGPSKAFQPVFTYGLKTL